MIPYVCPGKNRSPGHPERPISHAEAQGLPAGSTPTRGHQAGRLNGGGHAGRLRSPAGARGRRETPGRGKAGWPAKDGRAREEISCMRIAAAAVFGQCRRQDDANAVGRAPRRLCVSPSLCEILNNYIMPKA